jgi:hypothetical protein
MYFCCDTNLIIGIGFCNPSFMLSGIELREWQLLLISLGTVDCPAVDHAATVHQCCL